MMDDFGSETDSDYTSYWRDWVSLQSYMFCHSHHDDQFNTKFLVEFESGRESSYTEKHYEI